MSDGGKTHQPCDDCGSSDALQVNASGSSYCHACRAYTPPDGAAIDVSSITEKPSNTTQGWDSVATTLATGKAVGVPERGLSAPTLGKYGVVVDSGRVIYPYTDANNDPEVTAAKIRYPDKRFQTVGNWNETGLFGQSAFPKGGKYLTIVEGEYDALAAYQLMGSKYPVVSIKNGASGALKDCKKAYEWIDSFECVVICFDADKPGMDAAKEVANLFSGKAKVVRHPEGYKDACDYLIANAYDAFDTAFWRAEKYVPDGIVSGLALWDEVNKPMETAEVDYPFSGLNDLTYGIRQAELVTVTAGSGLGKSQFVRELVWHVLNNTESSIGLLFLEESVRKTALSMMSLHANKPLHLPTTESTEEERKASFDAVMGKDRLFMLDHFGSTDVDNIVSRVRYMAKGMDCKYIFLDHISIIVSAQAQLDERKAIDEIMTKLRMLVQETGVCLFVVSHLKRPDNKGHEEGAATSLAQLRGSASIAQLSDIVLGLERDGQAEDAIVRNTTNVRVLKNRFSGETGWCTSLYFDKATGRLSEMTNGEDRL
jgi:twinkle protein